MLSILNNFEFGSDLPEAITEVPGSGVSFLPIQDMNCVKDFNRLRPHSILNFAWNQPIQTEETPEGL